MAYNSFVNNFYTQSPLPHPVVVTAPVPPNMACTSLIRSSQLMPCMSEQQTNASPSWRLEPGVLAVLAMLAAGWAGKFMSHSKMQLPRQHIKLYGRPQKMCVWRRDAGAPLARPCINSDESLHLSAAGEQHPRRQACRKCIPVIGHLIINIACATNGRATKFQRMHNSK